MRYAQIRPLDVANGEGIRVTVFVTGCTLNCPECFNVDYQNPNWGELWTDKETERVLGFLNSDSVKGLTVLGGEPFQNTEGLIPLLKSVRAFIDNWRNEARTRGLAEQDPFSYMKNIWIYSGYRLEELLKVPERRELLELCDVLVDGRFVAAKKDLTLHFRGSSNQRILDVKKTLETDAPVLYRPEQYR